MRSEAEKLIGDLYPKVAITNEILAERPDLQSYLGQKLTVIAWLWARNLNCIIQPAAHRRLSRRHLSYLERKETRRAFKLFLIPQRRKLAFAL